MVRRNHQNTRLYISQLSSNKVVSYSIRGEAKVISIIQTLRQTKLPGGSGLLKSLLDMNTENDKPRSLCD